MPKFPPPPHLNTPFRARGRGGKGRGGKDGKGRSTSGKGQGHKSSAVPGGKWLSTLYEGGQKKTICMRFQTEQGCHDPACKYLPASPTYFTFGACPSLKSGTCSLCSCTESQPDLIRFVNALLLRFFPDGTWSSLWVNFDCKKLPHRDSQNALGSYNFIFSLGEFRGGGLWLEQASATPCGATLVPPLCAVPGTPHALRPRSFAASALRATMPWQGHRWLVTAYTCQHLPSLSSSASAILRGWGFPLPASVGPSQPAGPYPGRGRPRLCVGISFFGSRSGPLRRRPCGSGPGEHSSRTREETPLGSRFFGLPHQPGLQSTGKILPSFFGFFG